ncbi:hypothetical protein M569_04600, partial [Genlisea aurea]
DEYTQDGTVDLKGNPVLRSKTGSWTACLFLVGYEVFERMSYFGISSNLIIYLTTKLHQGTVEAANNVTNWVGTVYLTPILGAYIADAILGQYWAFLMTSGVYLLGMILLTLTVSLHSLKPPSCTDPTGLTCEKASSLQIAVYFAALYTVALGTGLTKPNISTIGADQFDEFDVKEKNLKLSFFNWWMFSISIGNFLAYTVLVYIQDNVGWSFGYGIPTVGLIVSLVIFCVGTPFYRHKPVKGSPFTTMVRVIVASFRKRDVTIPSDAKELYELDSDVYKNGRHRIDSTSSLRFLNKASVKTECTSRWILCCVTEVEETKQILRMIPVLATTFIPNTIVAQTGTLFVKQGTTLERNVGSFKIPPASLGGFVTLFMLLVIILYDRVFVRVMRKWLKNPRGITLLQRMGLGTLLYASVMTVACLVEKHRLAVAEAKGVKEIGSVVPLSIFILVPQFILMGLADGFFLISTIEFFYDQAPTSMKSLGTSYYLTSIGVGNFISSFLLTTISRVTRHGGGDDRGGWIQNNLNTSRLDYYYATLAVLCVVNFGVFLVVSNKMYVYKAEVSDSMKILRRELE